MNFFLMWVIWFVVAELIVTAVQLLLRKKEVKPAVRVVLIVVKALLAIATPTEIHLPRLGKFPTAVVTDESIAGQGHRATKDSVFSHVILLQS